jgi:hypothetical protein
MSNLLEVVEGWTGRLPFTLYADDEEVDLTGMTVSLLLRNQSGDVTEYEDEVTVDPDQSANKGRVYFDPPENAFTVAAGPEFRARFRVVDGLDKQVFFPNCKDADLILVGKP